MNDLFYVFGLALTAMALIVAFVGMRVEKFPSSRSAMFGVIGLMTFLVVGSAAFGVSLAREEHEHREDEIFEYRAEVEAEEGGDPSEGEEPTEIEAEGEPEETQGEGGLALTSPPEGDLVFEPDALETEAGEVTIDYTNPSEVPHNVAIEVEGETVAQGETVTGGASGPASARLEAGEFVFYCSVPGHREAGMEGTLTVE
ncbi:MAG: cupredoxin domain-containing protein [Actinomycetota bacterium]|nr:cupredoxin domain-containing protein [Actinomycetota bacterium]